MALAGHLIKQSWTHPVYLLMSPVFIATARERTLLGCNSPPQISHELCAQRFTSQVVASPLAS